jgi:2-polyprenyl-6-methoxyphenol hydroxylase-like FAD-dependent oxidoreductase
MPTLPEWVEDRLVGIGDAVHPFLPYRASGGAMAIEDAVSLSVMLPRGIAAADVPERLKVYPKARHERVTTIQEMTRQSVNLLPVNKSKYSIVFHLNFLS